MEPENINLLISLEFFSDWIFYLIPSIDPIGDVIYVILESYFYFNPLTIITCFNKYLLSSNPESYIIFIFFIFYKARIKAESSKSFVISQYKLNSIRLQYE